LREPEHVARNAADRRHRRADIVRHAASTPEHRAHRFEQFARRRRLGDVALRAGRECGADRAAIVRGGQHHDGQARMPATQLHQQFEAVRAR